TPPRKASPSGLTRITQYPGTRGPRLKRSPTGFRKQWSSVRMQAGQMSSTREQEVQAGKSDQTPGTIRLLSFGLKHGVVRSASTVKTEMSYGVFTPTAATT